MIITKEFNRKVERDYFFIQGILNIDSQYFIQKIKESCASKDNNNYKTNIKGLMTPFEFFKQDQKFLTEVIIPVIDYVDENYKLNNYHILDAWGFEVRPKEKTEFHDHQGALWSGVIYLNNCEQPLEFPQIKQKMKPQEGAFCVFNSFLSHGCKRNLDNISKFGISFNFAESKSW